MKPTRRVLMIGPALDSRGGMATVQALILSQPPDDTTVTHLASWVEEGLFVRVRVFAVALARTGGQLVTRRVDLMHLHVSERGSVARKLAFIAMANLTHTPVVVHAHGAQFDDWFDQMPSLARRLVRTALGRADLVVALSNTEADAYRSRLRLAGDRVAVLANPVPATTRTRPDPADVDSAASDITTILFAGRVGPRKGAHDLLEAFAAIDPERRCRTRLVMAGDGDLEFALSAARRLGIVDSVELTGWLSAPDLARRRAAADIFVLPSHDEALPMAILEAIADGLPVITTPVGSIGDVIAHDRSGLLVNPGDTHALARALEHLIDHPDERRRLVDGAAEVRERLSIGSYCRRLAELYTAAGS